MHNEKHLYVETSNIVADNIDSSHTEEAATQQYYITWGKISTTKIQDKVAIILLIFSGF